ATNAYGDLLQRIGDMAQVELAHGTHEQARHRIIIQIASVALEVCVVDLTPIARTATEKLGPHRFALTAAVLKPLAAMHEIRHETRQRMTDLLQTRALAVALEG